MFICITNLYKIIRAHCTCISSSIQLIQMFICITNIKQYNVKISDTIACRNVLFTSNLKKNKHTWLCKTPQKVAPIYPVIEPIDKNFHFVLRGNIWLHQALEPERWILLFLSLEHSNFLDQNITFILFQKHLRNIKINCITLFSTKTNL